MTQSNSNGRVQVLLACTITYGVALGVAYFTVSALPGDLHPIWIALIADLAATLVVFVAGAIIGNSSLYDPYWSVAPLVIIVYWALQDSNGDANVIRTTLVFAVVYAWGLRLTFNCFRRWTSLDHEDFRYQDLRKSSGKLYPLVDLFGIQIFPTLLVFAGCLPLYPALTSGAALGLFDLIAVLLAGFGIFYEALADQQLRKFLVTRSDAGRVCTDGVWGRSRHPNYLGEMSFWCGLWFFALAVNPDWWWTGIGALAMIILFVVISIPMMQTRHKQRRPDYEEQVKDVPVLLPKLSGRH